MNASVASALSGGSGDWLVVAGKKCFPKRHGPRLKS